MKTHRYIFEVEVIAADDCDCQAAHADLQALLDESSGYHSRVLGGARQATPMPGAEGENDGTVPNAGNASRIEVGSDTLAQVAPARTASPSGRSARAVQPDRANEKACSLGFAGCREDHSAEDDVNVHRQVAGPSSCPAPEGSE